MIIKYHVKHLTCNALSAVSYELLAGTIKNYYAYVFLCRSSCWNHKPIKRYLASTSGSDWWTHWWIMYATHRLLRLTLNMKVPTATISYLWSTPKREKQITHLFIRLFFLQTWMSSTLNWCCSYFTHSIWCKRNPYCWCVPVLSCKFLKKYEAFCGNHKFYIYRGFCCCLTIWSKICTMLRRRFWSKWV